MLRIALRRVSKPRSTRLERGNKPPPKLTVTAGSRPPPPTRAKSLPSVQKRPYVTVASVATKLPWPGHVQLELTPNEEALVLSMIDLLPLHIQEELKARVLQLEEQRTGEGPSAGAPLTIGHAPTLVTPSSILRTGVVLSKDPIPIPYFAFEVRAESAFAEYTKMFNTVRHNLGQMTEPHVRILLDAIAKRDQNFSLPGSSFHAGGGWADHCTDFVMRVIKPWAELEKHKNPEAYDAFVKEAQKVTRPQEARALVQKWFQPDGEGKLSFKAVLPVARPAFDE